MTTAARRPARAVAEVLATVLSAVAVTLIATAVPASAHDVLRSTNPADGTVVDRLPDRVVLTFDEPALAIGTEVVVTGPAGPVSDGQPQLVDAEVRQPVRAGPAGRYTVLWRVTSADGHPVSGTFAFTTQQGSAASPTATPATTTATVRAGRRRAVVIGVQSVVIGLRSVVAVARRAPSRPRPRPVRHRRAAGPPGHSCRLRPMARPKRPPLGRPSLPRPAQPPR